MAQSVRMQISGWSEIVSDLVLSAEQRYVDGEALLLQRRFLWAAYSFGLASEMWLKTACFYAAGGRPSDPVHLPLSRLNIALAGQTGLPAKESGHSLAYWSAVLIRYRRTTARPLSRALHGNLLHYVDNRLYQGWGINMRYRPVSVTAAAAKRMFADAAWLRRYHRDLWR